MSENTQQSQNNIKKSRLGRGLGSLLGEAAQPAPLATSPLNSQIDKEEMRATPPNIREAAIRVETVAPIAEEKQIWTVAIDRLTPNTQQPRQVFTGEALSELAASIKEKGILQPITARRLSENQFEIIAGERRWRAAQIAGLHEVPVILKKVTEQDSLELAIIENIQRENLNSMEEAEAFDHLMTTYSMTQQQMADKLGKDRSSIANTLRLLGLQPELKVMLRNNLLSSGHAKVLLGIDSAPLQISIAKQVVSKKLSVRATEKLVATSKVAAQTSQAEKAMDVDVPQRLIDGLSQELQKLLGTKVSIDYTAGKGKLSIHFYSDEQLTQIVEKVRRAWEK